MSDPNVRIGNSSDGSCNCCEYPDTVLKGPVFVFGLGGLTVRLCQDHFEKAVSHVDHLTKRYLNKSKQNEYFREHQRLRSLEKNASKAIEKQYKECDKIWNKLRPDEREAVVSVLAMSGDTTHSD